MTGEDSGNPLRAPSGDLFTCMSYESANGTGIEDGAGDERRSTGNHAEPHGIKYYRLRRRQPGYESDYIGGLYDDRDDLCDLYPYLEIGIRRASDMSHRTHKFIALSSCTDVSAEGRCLCHPCAQLILCIDRVHATMHTSLIHTQFCIANL